MFTHAFFCEAEKSRLPCFNFKCVSNNDDIFNHFNARKKFPRGIIKISRKRNLCFIKCDEVKQLKIRCVINLKLSRNSRSSVLKVFIRLRQFITCLLN